VIEDPTPHSLGVPVFVEWWIAQAPRRVRRRACASRPMHFPPRSHLGDASDGDRSATGRPATLQSDLADRQSGFQHVVGETLLSPHDP
jgi:hypothetical protein